jgi:SpoVK/Ycf46/Vps4 family AAA+-type ATPase
MLQTEGISQGIRYSLGLDAGEESSGIRCPHTANEVSQLPPEMLREGRFDELWFVDLPNQADLEPIWEIQIGNYGRDPKEFDLVQLARVTEGLTRSEIENVFIEALYLAFDSCGEAGEKEATDLDIAWVLTESVPLSKLMAEQINGLRSWAKGRARLAISVVSDRKLRRLAV